MRVLLALVAASGLGACSVEDVTFTRPGGAPMPDGTPALQELCATPGDEDGNGKADCLDPACAAGVATCAASAACNPDCSISRCGDGKLNAAAREEVDPPLGPSMRVPLNDVTCRYDFALITQLYCSGTCGAWGGGDGCQQQDADALCKLKTGNPNSIASSFQAGLVAASPGICCPNEDPAEYGCTVIGKLLNRGVTLDIYIDETSLADSHPGGQVVRNVTCTNP
jgi:hypothetical protein